MTTTEVGPADRSKLLRSKRAECSAIVTSRKRKLRELFAVATEVDGIPNFDFTDPDAPPTTTAEAKFLSDSDILQGRKLNELNIPPRPKPRSDALQRLLSSTSSSLDENAPQEFSKPALEPSINTLPPADPRQGSLDVVSGSPTGHDVQQVPPAIEPRAKPGTPQPSVGLQQVANGVLPSPDTVTDRRSLEHTPAASPANEHSTDTLSTPAVVSVPELGKPVSPTPERSPAEVDAVKHNGVDGQLPAGEPMDVDDQTTAHREEHREDGSARLLSIPIPPGDHSRVPDSLSSPTSTTHTAMTPAIHEASTDTSPDNEGPQYIDPEDEKSEEAKTPGAHEPTDYENRNTTQYNSHGSEQAQSPAQVDALGRVVDRVEAQLLEETAAASLAKNSEDTVPLEAPVPPTIGDDTLPSKTERLPQAEALEKLTSPVADGAPPAESMVDQVSTVEVSSLKTSQDLPAPPATASEIQALPLAPINTSLQQQGPKLSTRTPIIEVSPPVADSPASDRAVTRISSGALRQKSVSELLGESPKEPHVAPSTPKPAESPKLLEGGRVSPPQAVSTGPSRSLAERNREKRRKSIPTVVFGKPRQSRTTNDAALVSARPNEGFAMSDDYFTPLFMEAFTKQQGSWMKPLDQLLNQAHKTVSTPDQYVPIHEHQACRILRRVYHLQQHDKWSLRQPVRCPEPTRPPSHWDVLLQELKWMRTDFREERKWKRAVAKRLANVCAEWVAARPQERLALQVNAVIPPLPASDDVPMLENGAEASEDQLPDLIHSDSPTGIEDEGIEDQVVLDTIAPSAIFALSDDEVVFSLRPSVVADQLLEELPLYGSPLKVPKFDITVPEYDPDAHWKRPALPLSKYVEGKMVLSSQEPPRKRSRYSYRAEDEEDNDGGVVFGALPDTHAAVPPLDTNVALFNPEMKPIRDRLHAGHQFRPPTEYPMPLQSFYEARTASQWTYAEDDELKSLVREYSYNWSLISSAISTKSIFSSGPERRTPWECFERWVQLEGLPNDMSKTQYFKTYHSRIEAAQRAIAQQNQNAQQQVGPNGAVTPLPRRRPTTAIRVDRRRNQKHLALIDAMRKLAKKRETTIQKAQHAAAMAANRKQNEGQRPVGPPQTPREYSLMRWERDQKLAEKMAQIAQRQHDMAAQNRRAQLARQQQSQAGKIPASTPNGPAQVVPNSAQVSAATSAGRLNVPGQLAVPGQARPRMAMAATPNAIAAVQAQMGGGLVPPLPMNGIPQAQMQALQAQQRLPMNNTQPDINLVLQARRIQDQQRAAVQLQQQQQHQHQQPQQHQQQHPQQAGQQMQQMQGSSTGAQGSPNGVRHMVNGAQGAINQQQHYLGNSPAAMMAAYSAANGGGVSSPGVGLSMPNMGAGSPRPPQLTSQVQMPANIGAQLRELESKFRAQYPNHTVDSIRTMAMEHLGRVIARQQQLNQSAMNAAAGAVAQQAMANGITASTSPHQYAQLLRAQQQAQAAQAAAAAAQQTGHQRQSSGSQRQSSGSATPTGPVSVGLATAANTGK